MNVIKSIILTACLVFLFTGCGGGLQPGEMTPGKWTNFDGSSDTRRVLGRDQADNWEEWSNSPWWRPSDDLTRVVWKYLLTDGGYACLTSDELWTLVPDGAEIACRWRYPR